MNIRNIFTEDTDYNICLSWLCGITDGATWSINEQFGAKLKCPEGMNEGEWYDKTLDFFASQTWEDAIGYKHDYKVDSPSAAKEAERMARDLNALIDRVNADPDYKHWDQGTFEFVCEKDGKEYFTFTYHGDKKEACRISAEIILAELGDGDGENGGKGSLRNLKGAIADALYIGCDYRYADCLFKFRKA